MGEPGLEHQGRRAASGTRPGSVIFFGAVVAAYGATVVVAALLTYAMLAGLAAGEASEIAPLGTPQGALSLWVKLVLSAFLTASGLGLIRTHRWARSLFLALAVVRGGTLAMSGIVRQDSAVSAAGLVAGLLPDLLLYGVGSWFLTRPRIGRHFEAAPPAEGRG